MATLLLDPAIRRRVLDDLEKAFQIQPLFWDPEAESESAGPELISRFQLQMPGGGFQIFSKDADAALRDVASAIHEALGQSDAVSWGTIANALIDRLNAAVAAPETVEFGAAVDTILRVAGEQVVPRTLFMPILGLALPPGRVIERAGWRLSTFTDVDAQRICGVLDAKAAFVEHVEKEIADHYSGQPCLVVESCADRHMAEKHAADVARRAVAALRFFACAHADGRRHPRRPRIYAGPVRQHSAARMISLGGDSGPMVHRGPSGPIDKPYAPSAEHLDQLEAVGAGSHLYELIGQAPTTSLGKALLQAILWISEAEDEDADASAFLKYWTAVEALVSSHASQHKVARLSTVVPIGLACGDVAWADCRGIAALTRAVKRSYDLRSKVVHQGDFTDLTPADVRDVCQWAYRVTTNYAHLAKRGYSTTAQCEAEAQFIWEAHQGQPTPMSPRLRTSRRPGVGPLWTVLYQWMRTTGDLRCSRSLPRWFVESELVRSLTKALEGAGARVTRRLPQPGERRRREDACSFEAKLEKHRYDISCILARVTLRARPDVRRLAPRSHPVAPEPGASAKTHHVRARFVVVDYFPSFDVTTASSVLDSAGGGARVWVPQHAARSTKATDATRSVRAGILLDLSFDDSERRSRRPTRAS